MPKAITRQMPKMPPIAKAIKKTLMVLVKNMLRIGNTKAPWAQKTGAKNFPLAAKGGHKHL